MVYEAVDVTFNSQGHSLSYFGSVHKCPHPSFDSSVGRAVDCSCNASEIHRSLVQIRLEGIFAFCLKYLST